MRCFFFFLVVLFSLGFGSNLYPNDEWEEVFGVSETLRTVAYGNGTFVAAGETILYANEISEWNESQGGADYSIEEVIFADERFFAVGAEKANEEPVLLVSADGSFWEVAELPEIDGGNRIKSIAYQNGIWLAVSDIRTVIRSEDGVSWSEVLAEEPIVRAEIVWANGRFTAFASGKVFESVDGLSWEKTEVEDGIVEEVVFSEGRFFGRNADGEVWISGDGILRLYLDEEFSGIGRAGGLFVGLGESKLWISENLGDVFDLPVSFEERKMKAIASSEEEMVIVGEDGLILVRDRLWAPMVTVPPSLGRSFYPEGSDIKLEVFAIGSGELNYQWKRMEEEILGAEDSELVVEGVEQEKNQFEVVIENEHGSAVSGIEIPVVREGSPYQWKDWVEFSKSDGIVPETISYANGRFVGVKWLGAEIVMQSRDGTVWRKGEIRDFNHYTWSSLDAGGKFFIGGMLGGKAALAYSEDGIVWSLAKLPETSGPVRSVSAGNGVYVAAHAREVWTSEDGIEWERGEPAQQINLSSLAFGNGQFLGISNGRVLVSENGKNWSQISDQLSELNDGKLAFHENRWWILARSGVFFSNDGRLWMRRKDVRSAAGFAFVDGTIYLADASCTGGPRILHVVDETESGKLSLPDICGMTFAGGGDRLVLVGGDKVFVRNVELPPVIVNQPAPIGIDLSNPEKAIRYPVGGQFEIRVRVMDEETLSFQWEKDGKAIPGATESVFVIEDLQLEDSGSYAVRISNSAGSVLSRPGKIEVNPMFAELPTTRIEGGIGRAVFGNGRFVSFEKPYYLSYSTDGIHWEVMEIANQFQSFSKLIFGGGKFLVGGINSPAAGVSTVLSSRNGIDWKSIEFPESARGPIFDIVYGNEVFLANGYSGIWRSENGLDWEKVSEISLGNVEESLVFGNGRFWGSGKNAIYHSVDGENWEEEKLPEKRDFRALYFAGDRLWIRDSRGEMFQSIDSREWSAVVPFLDSVQWVGNHFVGMNHGGEVFLSADGTEWARYAHQVWYGLAEGNGRYLQGRSFGASVSYPGYSPEFILQPSLIEPVWEGKRLELRAEAIGSAEIKYQWCRDSEQLLGETSPVLVIDELTAEDEGSYYVFAQNRMGQVFSNRVRVEVSAESPVIVEPWERLDSISGDEIVFGDGRFVISKTEETGTGSSRRLVSNLWISRDGIEWRGGEVLNSILSGGNLVFGDGKFVAGGSSRLGGHPVVLVSDGRSPWQKVELSTDFTGAVEAIAWGDGIFLAATKGKIFRSEDGLNWSGVENSPSNFETIAHGNGYFLGVTKPGSIWKSETGETWHQFSQVEAVRLRFAHGNFYAIDADGNLSKSEDGSSWEPIDSISGIRDITEAGEILAAVGDEDVYYGTADGEIWIAGYVSFPGMRSLAVGGNRIIAVGDSHGGFRTGLIEPYAKFLTGRRAEGGVIIFGDAVGDVSLYSWYREGEWFADTEEPFLLIENPSEEDPRDYRVLVQGENGTTLSNTIPFILNKPPVIVSQPDIVFANPGETVRVAIEVESVGPTLFFQWLKNNLILSREPVLVLEDVQVSNSGPFAVMIQDSGGTTRSEPIELRVVGNYEDWADWKAADGDYDPEDLLPEADPDGTGISNLLRYALGLSGDSKDRNGLPEVSVETDSENPDQKVLVFKFQRRKTGEDFRFEVENSIALDDWETFDFSEADVSVEESGPIEIVTLRYPLTEENEKTAARFFRLAVEKVE